MKKIIALSLWLMTAAGGSTVFCGLNGNTAGRDAVAKKSDDSRQGHLAIGLQALKEDKFLRAEYEFTAIGDDARLAETFIRQGRYSEAERLVVGREDGQSKLMLAVVHQLRGEFTEYRRRLVEARNLGNEAARCLLDGYEREGV